MQSNKKGQAALIQTVNPFSMTANEPLRRQGLSDGYSRPLTIPAGIPQLSKVSRAPMSILQGWQNFLGLPLPLQSNFSL
jgi:hypothetical protein